MGGKRLPPIDDNMIRQVEELAGYGLSMAQIAAVIGFSERMIYERKAENEALSAALARGKAKAAAIVGKALFGRAKDGDVPAIRWWEMTREGKSERLQAQSKIEVTHDAETEARLARILGEAAARLEDGNAR